MKKIITLILCALLMFSGTVFAAESESTPTVPTVSSDADKWDGTTEEFTNADLTKIDGIYYYEISSAEQLAFLAETGGDWLTYNYILTTDIIINDVKLTWDENGELTNTEDLFEWTSIGAIDGYEFSGIFEGGGHTVSGGVGSLFRGITGELRNLNVVNWYSSESTGMESYYTGGIAAYLGDSNRESGSIISNCVFDGFVTFLTSPPSRGEFGIGGIVGVADYGSVIENCVNYADVLAPYQGGGIVGEACAWIKNCVNYGSVTVTKARYAAYAGGIAGSCTQTISDRMSADGCVNYGDIYAEVAGGIAATGDSVTDCINYGAVKTMDTGYAGGIMGYGQVQNSINNGEVTGGNYTGGIMAGGSRGHWASNCINNANVTGLGYAGGIGGRIGSASFCVNRGNVTGGDYTGGIIGQLYTYSNWPREIEYCYNLGNVTGGSCTGGIVGEIELCEITEVYSAGTVSGTENVGAVAGNADHIWGSSSISYIYYKDTGLDAVPGFDDEDGVMEARTEAELKTEEALPGFFREHTDWPAPNWAIDSAKNGGFPYLGFEEPPGVIEPTAIAISNDVLTLGKGERAYLEASLGPAGSEGEISWTSDDEDILTVTDFGMITALSPGTATVTASCGELEASCEVTVTGRADTEFELRSPIIRDLTGKALDEIPDEAFMVSVPVAANKADSSALILIAAYDKTGRMVEFMYAGVSGLNEGATVTVTLPVRNAKGNISEIRAFPVSSLGDMLGTAVGSK